MQDRPIPSSKQAPLRKQSTRVQGFLIQAAGVCLMALVIGSMAMVFYSSRPNTPGPAPVGASHPTGPASAGTSHPTATARPTLVVYHPGKSLGTIVYSTAISDSSDEVYGLAWSPDSKLLGVATSSAQSWFATTGKGVVNYGPTRNASVLAVVWSPDGQLMATAFFGLYGQTVQVWNTSTGNLVQDYTGHADVVGSLSWSADGTYVASSSADGSMQVWNALTGQRIYDFENNTRCNTAVAWSPDGSTLAYLYCDQVRVVNPFTGQLLRTHTGPHDSWGLSALAWSPDGRYIASAGDHIEMWSVATGHTYYTFTRNAPPINRLAWPPDGKYIASANYVTLSGTVPVTIQVWSAE